MSRALYVIEYRLTPDGEWATRDGFTSIDVAKEQTESLSETCPGVDYRVVIYVPEVKS